MLRVLILAFAAVAVAAGQAHARRVICEPEELASRGQQLASPAPPRPAPPPPLETNFCLPGADGDAGCRPHEPLPGPAGSSIPLLHDSFVLVKSPAVPPAPSQLLPIARSHAAELAAGHARRLERPPRSV